VAKIVVTPETFTLVFYDADRIAALAGDIADRIGLPADAEVRVEVDERMPLGRVRVTSLQPITVTIEGGAIEDAKHPRQMSERGVLDVLGRTLRKVQDRLSPSFGTPPDDDDLNLAQQTAWNVYAEGRNERLGLEVQKQRWLYHFRNRHGFNDVADGVFNRLWEGDGLGWADIEAACAETAAARDAAVA
jgi:hypothetical protein